MECRNLRREPRRSGCAVCGGSGRLERRETTKCIECKGAGWVLALPDKEATCPVCKGFKAVGVTTHATCKSCGGQGFIVQLYESREVRRTKYHKCGTCCGIGTLTELRKQDPAGCHSCKGSGHDVNATKKGLCYSTSLCPKCVGGPPVPVRVPCCNCGGLGKTAESYWETEERVVG